MENYESKFADLYKSNNRSDIQETRRKQLLKEQKLNRSLFQDESRNLQEIVFSKTDNKHETHKSKYKPRTFKKKYQIDAKLQLSEWLREKPENINDWFLVPCPKGQRCMVIACNGYTEMYTKSGRLIDTFQSLLPGNVGSKNDVTILDCVYVDDKSTFYILDALTFGNQDLINCEAQFRFFWLTSKFVENSYDEISESNPYAFECIRFYDFENTTSVSIGFQQFPLWEDNSPELDGFLFYHKEASYTFGTTPLVGWLFAFMVPEVLDFSVSPEYMTQKPENYSGYFKYIIDFDEAMAKKKYKHRRSGKMDSEDETSRDQFEDIDCDDNDASLNALLEAEKNLELEEDDIADDA
ncbi:snurportin-1 [Episyrphus balteatus]|uniref:snurportin-1 n=1 Tax=Episyrphus balteatus TaxID=286459 RepID=UPI0024855606|nr:snurportin-1 [Episyrphus balteatus]